MPASPGRPRRRLCRLSRRASRAVAFLTSFLAYAALHAARKAYTNVKPDMKRVWGFSESYLAGLDAVFMFAYSAGLYTSGVVGDSTSPKAVLVLGLVASSILVEGLGLGYVLLPAFAAPLYIGIMLANGLAQSTAWPNALAVMANWFPDSRGSVLGLWATNSNVGNVIGSAISAAGEAQHMGISAILGLHSLLLLGVAALVWTVLDPSPELENSPQDRPMYLDHDHGVSASSQRRISEYSEVEALQQDQKPHQAIGVCRALLIPGVVEYSFAYACIKNMNYTCMFWLAFYLQESLGFTPEASDNLTMAYDIGGVLGSMVAGVISDRIHMRSPVVVVSLLISAVSLGLLSVPVVSVTYMVVLLLINGAMINGPACLISGAISADLGSHSSLKDNQEAMATVAGIVDGTGSFGAAIGQLAAGAISQRFDWGSAFMFLAFMSLLALLCVSRLFYHDMATVWARRRQSPYNSYGRVEQLDHDT